MNEILAGISSMATRALLVELCAAYERAGGTQIRFESVGGVDAMKRVRGGEPFDLVVLAADAIDGLAETGSVYGDSRSALVNSEVAIAVPTGAARPDISSEPALRSVVLDARGVGYSTGPSGKALIELFARWGVTEELKEKLVLAPPGVPVATLVTGGQASVGFQQFSELVDQPGVVVLGLMPPGLEIVTTFVGAIGIASRHIEAARAALAFMRSPDMNKLKQRHGMSAPLISAFPS